MNFIIYACMDSHPFLNTKRLYLRKPTASDIPCLVQLADNPKIYEMTLNMPHCYDEDTAIPWINMANEGRKEESHFIFAIALKPEDKLIGGIGLRINKQPG